jgi:hypothetical protein
MPNGACARPPILYFATSLAVYFTGRLLSDERTGFWAGLLTALTTGIVFSSRIISTDIPLLLFWAVALLACTHLLIAPNMRWATVLGVSIGLGLAMQAALLVTDAMATRIAVPFLKNPNPYSRLGWRAYGERIGQLAMALQAPTIASDDRGIVAALRHYWRDRPVEILSWGTTESPEFDKVHPLTQSAVEPILFVTQCPDQDRAQQFYAEVQSLGVFKVPVGSTGERILFAYRLAAPRGSVAILPECSQ